MENQRVIDEKALRKEVVIQIETETLFTPLAAVDLVRAEQCDLDELIKLAKECGIDIEKFYLDEF